MEKTTFTAKTYLGVTTPHAKMENMKEIFEGGYASIMAFAEANGIQFIGPPVGLYTEYNEAESTMTTTPGIEVAAGTTVPEDSGFVVVDLPEGEALHHQHVGSYDGLMGVHEAMSAKLMEDNLPMGTYAIEVYMTDPAQEPDESKWVTEVYYQLA